ncbi:MAG: MurR/RpiR family transcriptional regulator [Hyphomicrobiales bacterium]
MSSKRADSDASEPAIDFSGLVDILVERQSSLPKRLREFAQFCLNNPEDVAMYNIVSLSQLAGVPAATITRFAKEMGFAGFAELQAVFRQRLIGPRMTYADRIKAMGDASAQQDGVNVDLEHPRAILDTFFQTGVDSLLRLRDDVQDQPLEAFVDCLAGAAAVHIAAARGAYGVGAYCFYGFSKTGKPAHMIDNLGAMREQQVGAVRSDDVVLVLTFDDYTPETVDVAKMAVQQNKTVIAITDNELSPVVKLAKHVLYVKEARLGHFRSQVPALVLCQSIIVSVGQRQDGVS